MKSSQIRLPLHKDFFLIDLRGKGKHKYSRYKESPLRYAGGKSLGVGYIIEHIPDNINRLMSPFVGGASVEIACAKELGIHVHAYDIFDILVNYWQVQLTSANSLSLILENWEPSKDFYSKIKDRLKLHWENKSPILDPVDLASHYWFNHNLSYGPMFLGWMSSLFESESKYKSAVNRVRQFECKSLEVNTGIFEETIPSYPNEFLYCDPPYYLDDGKMFKGMYPQRNFPIHHDGFKHELLRDLLHNHKNGFVLSYNDCQTIREWYSDFDIIEVEWQYTMGQGETRIGKNRIDSNISHVKQSHELLIVKSI